MELLNNEMQLTFIDNEWYKQMDGNYIFIVNGPPGVGKDTFVDMFMHRFISDKNISFYTFKYSSVDYIKGIAEMLGWNGVTKTEKDRKMLADLKTLCTNYNDLPYKKVENFINEFKSIEYADTKPKVLFIFIREPKEIERVKTNFNAKTILITRNSVEPITSNEADANVFGYTYDIFIDNSLGMRAVYDKVLKFGMDLYNRNLKAQY